MIGEGRRRVRRAGALTVASTGASVSALPVNRAEDGVFAPYRLHDRNPGLVLIDTRLVTEGPASLSPEPVTPWRP